MKEELLLEKIDDVYMYLNSAMHTLNYLKDKIKAVSDPEVPDFDESPQDPWYPVKDVTTDFVRSGLWNVKNENEQVDVASYAAGFTEHMKKHNEVMERMLTSPRK